MRRVGYREASCLKSGRASRGWTVEGFMADARRLESGTEPASLLRGARELLSARIEAALADPGAERLSDVARVADVAEKWYSDADRPGLGNRSPAERMRFVEDLVVEALRRGLIKGPALPTAKGPALPTAQIIDTAVVSDAASDKGEYVTLPQKRQLPADISETLDF
jgi:hypothetical protein